MNRPKYVVRALQLLRAVESIGDPDLVLYERRIHEELARFEAAGEEEVDGAGRKLLDVVRWLARELRADFAGHPALEQLGPPRKVLDREDDVVWN